MTVRLESKVLPVPEETTRFGHELIKIVQLKLEQVGKSGINDLIEFSQSLLINWDVLTKIIRRRIFNDKDSGDIFINVDEIDYLHTDAMHSLTIGSLLPCIDFDLVAPLGTILCDIYSNLANYIDSRLKLVEEIKDPLEAAFFRKETLDILRVRSFRHKNCCNTFLDMICLQDAFSVSNIDALSKVITIASNRKLQPVRIEGTEIILFATPALLTNETLLETFCHTEVAVPSSLHNEILLIFNHVEGLTPLLDSMDIKVPILDKNNLLAKYVHNSPSTVITVVSKSIMELRVLVQEFKEINGMERWDQFRGLNMANNGYTFVHFREKMFGYVGNICNKLMSVNTTIAFNDLDLLTKNGFRQELDRSLFVSAYFVFEFLLEVPCEMPFLQNIFESYISSSTKWLPLCLRGIMNGQPESDYHWLYLEVSYDVLNPLLALGIYEHPDYFKEAIQDFNKELAAFSKMIVSPEKSKRHAYLVDAGRCYMERMSGEVPKNRCMSPSIRFPDQALLESRGYWVISILGSANNKLIYKCIDQRSRRPVVIKRLDKSKLHSSSLTKGELGALMSLSHTNIVRYIECFEHSTFWFMVMEYCEDRVLAYCGEEDVKLDELDARRTIRQVIAGLAYLHNSHVVHRDIKPENLLKDGRGFVKIADFGEAQLVPFPLVKSNEKFDLKSLRGTPAYMAPECLFKSEVFPSADIWSMGCVLLYLVTGKRPWQQYQSSFNIMFALASTDELPADIDTLSCSEDCKRILRMILKRNPDERPTLSELLRDPYFFEVTESLI